MLKIRLSKIGKTNSPSYRVVVAEAKSKRTGKSIDILGYYNPLNKKDAFVYDKEKYTKWISLGATPTEGLKDLINGSYVFKKYTPKKDAAKDETAKGEEPTAV